MKLVIHSREKCVQLTTRLIQPDIMHITTKDTLVIISCILLITSTVDCEIQNRIIGGSRVKYREQCPYQISLRANGHHICGGSIYKPNYVITAAHCLNGIHASQLEVVAGDLHLSVPTKHTQRRRVAKFHVHEEYDQFTRNDIAVLKLKHKLQLNNYVRNIRIWNETRHLALGHSAYSEDCVVSGWGATSYQGVLMKDLRSANVTLFGANICDRIYLRNFIPSEMVCAGNLTGAHDACSGDSGGPLVCGGYLYGVVSWGIDCGRPQFPGVYTNASYYGEWIKLNTNSASIVIRSWFICIMLVFIIQFLF